MDRADTTQNDINLSYFKEILEAAKKSEKCVTRSDIMQAMKAALSDKIPEKVILAGSQMIFETLADFSVSGYRTEIRGFGSISTRYLPPRTAHNPRTGDKVKTLGKYRLYFRTGLSLKERVAGKSINDYNIVNISETEEAV